MNRAMTVSMTAAVLALATPVRADAPDAVFYDLDTGSAGDAATYRLVNLVTRSVAFGLVGNGARTGLGTNVSGRSLTTESLYYQAVRIYSYFDVAFQRSLLSTGAALPRSVVIAAGRFSPELIGAREDEDLEAVDKFRRAAALVVPELSPFHFRRFAVGDFAVVDGSARFAPDLAEALYDASVRTFDSFTALTYVPDGGDVEDKLLAMLDAFSPLATVYYAGFDNSDRERSYTRLQVFLPALHTLVADDADHAETWYLDRGIARTELPTPVQISVAEIISLSYLQDADPNDDQAISVEIRRDFAHPDRVRTVAKFGLLRPGTDGALLDIDTADHRNALYVGYRIHFAVTAGDNAATRWAKRRINAWTSGFSFDARIHQLTLDLVRDGDVLRPTYSRSDSVLSFRASRWEHSWFGRTTWRGLGFTCESDGYCWRDFSTWNLLIAFAAQQVIDVAIPSIEDAIDSEIARVFEDLVDHVWTARTTLKERLHGGLFE